MEHQQSAAAIHALLSSSTRPGVRSEQHQHHQQYAHGMSGSGAAASPALVDPSNGTAAQRRHGSSASSATQNRERRTSQLSSSSTSHDSGSNSRRNSGGYSRYSAVATTAATAAPASTTPLHASAAASTPSSSFTGSMSMLQGIEAQLQIPPFRGGPQASRNHYNTRSSTAASSAPMAQRAVTVDHPAQQQQQYYDNDKSASTPQPQFYASYNSPPAAAAMLTPPSSLSHAQTQQLYASHQPSSSSSAAQAHLSTPSHRQGAPLPPGVVSSAATTSAAGNGNGGASNRNRASHQIMPVSAAGGHASPPVNIALHTAQYNIPGQRKVCFGDYQLLHTLGEGEFGKVKLGVHKHRWGEEVAIKLIKKGSIENSARSMKVQREIEVLKMVRHPHIVRLHEVVETDRFIGIVLEYASGGELFEYILAHKHLRETMACKLFAQLISGVAYLHSKKIVHRDLKLENLLLDRNKDIVITDFGFANRFNEDGRDLMATSCGSPCYAAPELVLQDGQYVGSAVDVWSCGVILYAMLSGYLPYDDDPANPDGDNINLLYRYITTTQLAFPEWISPEPRELLLMMLVAEPTKRCTLRDVMRHPWLRRYANFFQNSVPELEMQAEAQYEEKRVLLARQQEHYFRSTGQAMPPHLQRSQSTMAGFESQHAQSIAQQRHRSAMVHSVTTQSMIPEFAAPPQQFQQPRPSLPIHLQGHGGLVSPPLSPPMHLANPAENANVRNSVPASAYPHIQFSDPFANDPTLARQQQQRQTDPSFLSSSTMQPSLSAPGDVETVSDSLTSEGEMRGEPRSRRTDDDDASTTSSSNRGTRSSARASTSAAATPASPGATESKKRKGEEKRHTISMDYPASPPAESTRSKTRDRNSLIASQAPPQLSLPTTVTSPSLPANIAAYLGNVGEEPRDTRLPILEAAAAAESMDVHMQSPNTSPARSMEDHSEQQARLPTVRTAPAAAAERTSSWTPIPIVSVPSISPVDEKSENVLQASSPAEQADQQDGVLQPRQTAPQPSANVTPPSSPRKEAVSPSRTPKRSNGTSTAAAAREALEASQRTPKASAQHQQQQQQAALSSSAAVVQEQPRSAAVPFPSPKQEKRPATATATHFDLSQEVRPSQTKTGTTGSGKSASSGGAARHKKGLSLSRLLGSSTTSVDRTDASGEPSRSRKDSLQESRPASGAGTAGSLTSIDEDNNAQLDKSRNRRRKALSLVVDPFGRSSTSGGNSASQQAKNRRSARIQPTTSSSTEQAAIAGGRGRSGTAATQASSIRPSGLPASSSTAQFPISPSLTSITATPGQSRQSLLPASHISQVPSANVYTAPEQQQVQPKQAKRGSGWFRWSKGPRESLLPQSSSMASGISHIPQPVSSTKRDSITARPPSAQLQSANAPVTRSRQSTATQPTVVVTNANAVEAPAQKSQQSAVAPERERVVATPAEARTFASTHRSGLTAQRSLRNKVVGASEASSDAFDDSKLKVHSGATDKRCVTKTSPPQIMEELKKTLYGMGMELERDSDYRWKATRRSRKQVANLASSVTSPSIGMSPSPSSTFRSFFGRKNSSTTTGSLTGQSMPSPALTTSSQLEGTLESAMLSPTISNYSTLQPQALSASTAAVNNVMPFYGGKADSGGEVRYSVEIVRVRGLTGIYTLDFRRMKGSLSDYRENHDALLDRLTLGAPL